MAKQPINISQIKDKNGYAIEIKENEGKFRAFITETIDGVKQPTRMGYLDKIGQGDDAFMTVSAPLREKNEDGSYKMRARQKDGKFLDAQGKEVDSEDKAAQEYVYQTQRDDPSKLVFGQVATLNIKNTKADQSPTMFTMMSVKMYTDEEALTGARLQFAMSREEDKNSEAYLKRKADLQEQRRSTGTYMTFFIDKGADALREMGFTVREREVSDQPAP